MRQQRTDNARGRVQRPNIRPIPDITWLIVSAGVHECRILLGVPNTDVHLQGIPQMVYGTDGSTPESATIDTNYLHLNYASTIVTPCYFFLPAADPAIRSNVGAFLATAQPVITVPAQPVQPEQPLDWSIGSVVGYGVNIIFANPVTRGFQMDMLSFQNTTIFQYPTDGSFDGTTLLINYGTLPASGQTIEYPELGIATWLTPNQVPKAQIMTIP